MRKILFIIPFFLWTCGGGGSSPTEPELQLPTVENITLSFDEDTSNTFTFLGIDPLGQTLTYSLSTEPLYGSVIINNDQGTYTPNENYNGPDTFTYYATNRDGNSNIGTVLININAIDEEPIFTIVEGYSTCTNCDHNAIMDDNGDIIIIVSNNSDSNTVILKVDDEGNIISEFSTSLYNPIIANANNGYIIGGRDKNNNFEPTIIKLNSSLNTDWSITLDSYENHQIEIRALKKDIDDNSYFIATNDTGGNGNELIKIDNQGTILWSSKEHNQSNQPRIAIDVFPNGNILHATQSYFSLYSPSGELIHANPNYVDIPNLYQYQGMIHHYDQHIAIQPGFGLWTFDDDHSLSITKISVRAINSFYNIIKYGVKGANQAERAVGLQIIDDNIFFVGNTDILTLSDKSIRGIQFMKVSIDEIHSGFSYDTGFEWNKFIFYDDIDKPQPSGGYFSEVYISKLLKTNVNNLLMIGNFNTYEDQQNRLFLLKLNTDGEPIN